MYQHSCKTAGAEGCGFTASAGSEDELKAKLNAHVRSKHAVNAMTDTIYSYLRAASSR